MRAEHHRDQYEIGVATPKLSSRNFERVAAGYGVASATLRKIILGMMKELRTGAVVRPPKNLEAIREKIAANPSAMTSQLARALKVPEIEVIRALPNGNVVELDVARWEPIIRSFESLEKVADGATCQSEGIAGLPVLPPLVPARLVYRRDILAYAYHCCKSNKGAAGVDKQSFEDIEEYGVDRWLDELTQELKSRTYQPAAVRRVHIPTSRFPDEYLHQKLGLIDLSVRKARFSWAKT